MNFRLYRGILAIATIAIPLAALAFTPARVLAGGSGAGASKGGTGGSASATAGAAATLTVTGESAMSLATGQELHLYRMRRTAGTRVLNFDAQPSIVRRVPMRCFYEELDATGNVISSTRRGYDINAASAAGGAQSVITLCSQGPGGRGLSGELPPEIRGTAGHGVRYRVAPFPDTAYRYFRFTIDTSLPANHQACIEAQMAEFESYLEHLRGRDPELATRIRGFNFSVFTSENPAGGGVTDANFVADPETGGNGVIVPLRTQAEIEGGQTPAFHFAVGVRSDGSCRIANRAALRTVFREDGRIMHATFEILEYLRRLNRGIPGENDFSHDLREDEGREVIAELPTTGESNVDPDGINDLDDFNGFDEYIGPSHPGPHHTPADAAV